MKLKYNLFCVDFDGTIVHDAYPNIGELIPGAKETMEKIKELGGKICIWTCRTGQQAEDVKEFLKNNNVPYDTFNESFEENINQYGGDGRKVYADVYIDDRCILWQDFGEVNWDLVYDKIFEEE